MNSTKHCSCLVWVSIWYRHLPNSSKHNVKLDSGQLATFYEKMTSSSKPEVHNLLKRCQRTTEPRPQAACIKNLVKFDRVVFELCKWTNRQTDILITVFCTPPKGKVIMTILLTDCLTLFTTANTRHHILQ